MQPGHPVADRGRGGVPPGGDRLEADRGHHVRFPGAVVQPATDIMAKPLQLDWAAAKLVNVGYSDPTDFLVLPITNGDTDDAGRS